MLQCRHPEERDFFSFFLFEHSLTHVKYQRKNDPTTPLERAGFLVGAAMISLFIIFAFTRTSTICKQQEMCIEGCKQENTTMYACSSTVADPLLGTTRLYVYHASTTATFLRCAELASTWDMDNKQSTDVRQYIYVYYMVYI